MNMVTRDPEPNGNPAYNQSPPQFDKDLVTRSSLVCGDGRLDHDQYNVGLHVMALFVVLAQSTLGAAFPLIAKKFPFLRIPPNALFFVRHFGTGVLIATAFVHLLPTAFISLNDPCLPAFWNKTYPAIPGAIAMVAVFFVMLTEMIFTKGHLCAEKSNMENEEVTLEAGYGVKERKRRKNKRAKSGISDESNDNNIEDDNDNNTEGNEEPGSTSDSTTGSNYAASEEIGGKGGVGKVGFGMVGRRRSRSHSFGRGLRRVEAELQRVRSANAAIAEVDSIRDISASDSPPAAPQHQQETVVVVEDDVVEAQDEKILDQLVTRGHGAADDARRPVINLTPQQKHKKALLQVVLLEMGILFHSVFIGMALSVTVGPEFVVLLIAIIFHQTFEGLALGSRIAAITWKAGAIEPWLMALAYGLTTPIGQAIGLATHTLYSPDSQTGLLMVGIMNAISSGLLVFAALVELLAEDFLSDDSWRELRGARRVAACVCVALGAVGMATVGAYA